jgi:hypothetical protein
MASFRSEAEAFSGMSGMVEGHARYARGLKPRALDRGVVHSLQLVNFLEKNNTFLKIAYCKSSSGFKILDCRPRSKTVRMGTSYIVPVKREIQNILSFVKTASYKTVLIWGTLLL